MNLYHKRFINSFASENVIGIFSRYNNSHKEVTESWGMLEAAKKFVPSIDEYKVIVIGDGASPRTGALFAYYTKADVISIDPNFNMEHWKDHVDKQTKMGFPPQRLKVWKEKIENCYIDCRENPCLVLWPHAHAVMDEYNITGYSRRIDINMPCCVPVPHKYMIKSHIMFKDNNILSPQNIIHIWGVIGE